VVELGCTVLLVVTARLATISPALYKKTPCPFSQQVGSMSRQRLPSEQVVTRGRKPLLAIVSSVNFSLLVHQHSW